jgi:hypothetical protein
VKTLPPHLATLLASAGTLAGFLEKTNFPEPRTTARLRAVSTLEGAEADYAEDGDGRGLAAFLEAVIRGVHSSIAFDAHVRTPAVASSGHRVPRLRHLVPKRPEAEAYGLEIVEAFVAALSQAEDPAEAIDTFLYGPIAEDLLVEGRRRASFEALLWERPALGVALLDRRASLASRPVALGALLRFGARFFARRRHYERAYGLARAHLDELGLGPEDVEPVLGVLWHAALRTGRRAEALAALDLWQAHEPLATFPPVYRSILLQGEDPEGARAALQEAGADLGLAGEQGAVLWAERMMQDGDPQAAERSLRIAAHERARIEEGPASREILIALHNVATLRGRPSHALRAVFERQGAALDWEGGFGIDGFADRSLAREPQPGRVAVIVTAYQAEAHLERAARAVLDQSHAELELILVDDCSTDGTAALCARLAKSDPRVRALRTPRNLGTYAAKNHGIRDALTRRPSYVALCDADDVWLRDHLMVHLEAMAADPDAVCTTSKWLRVLEDGRIECGPMGRYIETCPHSTFFKRGVFKKAGLFDAVRFGADTEFLNRLALHFGPKAISALEDVLTLGRRRDASLTSAGSGAFAGGDGSPARRAYWEAWNAWHLDAMQAGTAPRIDPDPDAEDRPFPVPDEMRP